MVIITTINPRQRLILKTIVKEYKETAKPVSSEALVSKHYFQVSPATLRLEMSKLEERGYLYQPHTSAGRIPTDKGYRFFIDSLMDEESLTYSEKEVLRQLLKFETEYAKLINVTAKVLAMLSKELAVSAIPQQNDYYTFGIKNLLVKPEFKNNKVISNIAELIDHIDQIIGGLFQKMPDKTTVLIGQENPVFRNSECSMVIGVSPFRPHTAFKQEGKVFVAIIGSKRMAYAKNISLVEYVKQIFCEC